MDRMDRRTKLIVAGCILALLAGVTVAAAGRADAAVKPAKPLPCKSCTYWTTDLASKEVDGMTVVIRGFAEHVVYADGRDHIRNIAWSGETDFGPLAFDAVHAKLRIHKNGPPASEGTWVWDPAQRWGQQYVGRRNGRTVHGIDTVVTAWWRGQQVRVVVSPDEVVEGELESAALAQARR
jgi:hypothetical protein